MIVHLPTIPLALRQQIVGECLRSVRGLVADKKFIGYNLVATGFDVANLLGADVPNAKSLTENYWHATGPFVWPGTNPLFSAEEMEAWVHELTHVSQWWADPFRMPIWYVQHDEMRGLRYESEAYAQGLAMHICLTGYIPRTAGEVRVRYQHGYSMSEANVQSLTNMLEGQITTVSNGIIPPGITRRALKALHDARPSEGESYIHPTMLAQIQRNNPGVLL